MVFKIFQELPLTRVSLFLQLAYAFFSLALVFFLELSKTAFLAGFVFSYLYMGIFFYSIKLIFIQKKKILGVDGKSFLLGLVAILVFLLSYALEQMKKLS